MIDECAGFLLTNDGFRLQTDDLNVQSECANRFLPYMFNPSGAGIPPPPPPCFRVVFFDCCFDSLPVNRGAGHPRAEAIAASMGEAPTRADPLVALRYKGAAVLIDNVGSPSDIG